jgi:hypothetical protein
MGSSSRLGAANLVLVSLYFAPVWGRDAIRTLMSPYNGLEDRVHSAAAVYVRTVFDLSSDGLMLAANMLAGLKLVIAAGFLAYAIEYARASASDRDVDRATVDVVLALAIAGIAIWALPALALGDAALVRLYSTQLLLVGGAIVVILVERHIERPTEQASRVAMAEQEREATARHVAHAGPAQPVAALSRAPERR